MRHPSLMLMFVLSPSPTPSTPLLVPRIALLIVASSKPLDRLNVLEVLLLFSLGRVAGPFTAGARGTRRRGNTGSIAAGGGAERTAGWTRGARGQLAHLCHGSTTVATAAAAAVSTRMSTELIVRARKPHPRTSHSSAARGEHVRPKGRRLGR